jgi:hypothetical protein
MTGPSKLRAFTLKLLQVAVDVALVRLRLVVQVQAQVEVRAVSGAAHVDREAVLELGLAAVQHNLLLHRI